MAPRTAKGSAYQDPRTGKFFAQIAMGKGKRKGVLCPLTLCDRPNCSHRIAEDGSTTCTGLSEARERSALASELVALLTAAGQGDFIEGAIKAATTLPVEKLPAARKHAEAIAGGRVSKARADAIGGLTFAKFAERVTNGQLRKDYPDHVREIGAETLQDYTAMLRDYVTPKLGPLPVTAITLDHCLDVMREVPRDLSSSRRRAIAFVMSRVLSLATFPARLIPSNPIPKGFLPKLDAPRARGFLFPDEEARLLRGEIVKPQPTPERKGTTGRFPAEPWRGVVPLPLRVLFGLLTREGMRANEAASLEYSDKRKAGAAGWVDLDRGWVWLDKNKTDDARDWSLSPDVAEALRRWRKLAPKSRLVFPSAEDAREPMNVEHLADDLRTALEAIGIDRPELFESSKHRRNIVAHDLRGVFVTLAMAQGKNEAWIQTRTGHTTSQMLARYRRRAAELGEGDRARLVPMHDGIPELAASAPKGPPPPPAGTEGTVCGASAPPANAGECSRGTAQNTACARADADNGEFRFWRPQGCGGSSPPLRTDRENEGDSLARGAADRPSSFGPADTSADTSPTALAIAGLARAIELAAQRGLFDEVRRLSAAIAGLTDAATTAPAGVVSLATERAKRGAS